MGQSPNPLLRQWMLLCLLMLPLHSIAGDESPTNSEVVSELKHFKELSKQQLSSTRELLQQDIQAQGQRIDVQDKRFDDHGKRLDGQDKRLEAQDGRLAAMDTHIDLWIGGFGLLATLFGLAIPLTAFFSVKNRATIEARKAASEAAHSEVAGWLNGKRVELELEIEALRSRVTELQKESDTHAQTFQRDLNKTRAELEAQAKALLEKDLQNSDRASTPRKVVLSAEQQESLATAAKAALAKPESQYQASDWNNRAFAALATGDDQEAIRCWTKVAQIGSAPKVIQAQALFNKGVILHRVGDHKAALTAYSDLIQHFISDSDETIRGLLAKAILNKGVTLGRQNQPEAELATYDELTRHFGNDTVEGIREQVAKAMFNKSVRLGQLDKLDAKIAVCDDLIRRFAGDTTENIRQTVAVAQNSKGFTLLCRAKQYWSDEASRCTDLRQARQIFAEALSSCSDEDRGMVLGNQSYCAHLLDEPAEVTRPTLRQALQLGGEKTYKGTLDDLAIHPVPEKDEPFRALLEEVWSEVHTEENQ